MSEGVKFDQEKDPWHLAPWDAFRAIVLVLAFGAKKYTKRYETPWHSLLSASFVTSVRVDTLSGNAVLVTRDIFGRLTLNLQNANGQTVELGRSETKTASDYFESVGRLAQTLVSEIGEPGGSSSLRNTASPKNNTSMLSNVVAPYAAQSATLTLTTITQPGSSEECFAASATTALGCLETLWKDLSGRFPIFAAHSLEIAQQGQRNWEKGMAWSRPFSALHRHLVSWWEGEKADPETGYSHLWHAGCCIVFLISFEIRGIGTDDRPNSV